MEHNLVWDSIGIFESKRTEKININKLLMDFNNLKNRKLQLY